MTIADVWRVALAVLASLGGGGVIVVMLSSWLGKVWANRILEQDRAKYASEMERLKSDLDRTTRLLQGEIEKTIFVTKTHFETEFKILREIWEKVSDVRSAMSILRPMSGYPTERHEQDAHFARIFDTFLARLDKLRITVDNNSPFYAQELFVVLDAMIRIAQSERDDLIHNSDDRFRPEWFRRGQGNFLEYMGQVEKCSALIRERLSKLAVRGLALQSPAP